MRIHLTTLGCRLNEAETERWGREFQARGHQIARRLEEADVVVINTCAVTSEAVKKSRKLMHRAHHRNPRAKLVVSGCHASLDPAGSAQADGVDLVVDNRDKERLVEIAERELDLCAMPALATLPGASALLARGRQRAFVKIQDGCRYQCTFCIVTVARGAERSRPAAEIVDEINALHAQGIQEAVLTGVHLGGYDSDHGGSLSALIERLLEQTRIPRLRLGALEPWDLPPGFWRLFNDPRLMPHLHLPLQSGADTVLRRMGRRVKSAQFEALAGRAQETDPDFTLTTDIIVGFPGESDREWSQTLALVERVGFAHLHIFAYSPRPGARAATLPDPLSRELIRARSEQLHRLGEQLERQLLERFTGREFPVLIEGDDHALAPTLSGYTPNFLRVRLGEGAPHLINTIRNIRLEGLAEDGCALRATLIEE
ncbi:MAG: tRNA (N(6)-L-threonylcarbamoyladenosine(37)-C(2))-methylthiotransferase MtaB [gamma proteobacterium symbiont of Phacoides pectinatus]